MNSHGRPTTCECRHSLQDLHCESWNERPEFSQRSNWVLGLQSIKADGLLLQGVHRARINDPSQHCQQACVRLRYGAPMPMWRSLGHDLKGAPSPPDRTAEHRQSHHYWFLLQASQFLGRSCPLEPSRWAHYQRRPDSPLRKSV